MINSVDWQKFAQATGASSREKLVSVFGRLSYDYKQRYLVSAVFRYDGSSRLAPDHRWAFFPSVSLAWRIDQENFMKNAEFIDQLKPRFSWGKMGNQAVSLYSYLSSVNTSGYDYSFDGTKYGGAAISALADNTITWEETTSYNAGIDFSAFGNRVLFSADWFLKRTEGILRTVNLPSQVGDLSGPKSNVGVVDNKGIELSLTLRDSWGDFSAGISGNFSYTRNEIVDLNGETEINGRLICKEGYPINSWYLLETDGVFQNQSEIDNAQAVYGNRANLRPGYVKYVNQNIDYTIDGNNDKYDWSKNALRPLAVDKKFDFFNPKVGLNWNITSNHRVYASFSVAQKEPTRNNYTDGDPDSYPKAEKLLDYEAGYTFANQWLTAGANFYYMDYTDQLVLTGALNDIGEALTENVPDSYRMGIEIMLGIKPCKWFQWDINATWSKNRIQDFVESLPGYHYNDDGSSTSLPTIQIKHKDTHIAFSPDFLLNNRFSFNYKGFEAALQSQFVSKQYMTNAEVEELTLDKYFVSNLNLAYSFRPKKVLKEVTIGFTVYNLFNEKYENNGWASSDYTDTLENRGNYAGYAAQAGTNVMGHVSFRF